MTAALRLTQLRTFTLFYSWQSDRPSDLCRNFIAEALKLAAEKIRETRQVIVIIDADTQGVSGTPPISETILKKIDRCDAFLADLTLVATTQEGKASPNPNVLIEYGYALKAKGSPHLILAMNTAFGGPQNLPFDLRHLRHPLQYAAIEGLPHAERRKLRAQFAEKLIVALNVVIDQVPERKKSTRKEPDLESQTVKRITSLQKNRGHIQAADGFIPFPRIIIDIIPFATNFERRLDLRLVKAAWPWFAPNNDEPINSTTKAGQWIICDPPREAGWRNEISRWWTRLTTLGYLERIFIIGNLIPSNHPYHTLVVDSTVDGFECDRQIISAIRRSGELFAAVGLGGTVLISLSIQGGKNLQLLRSTGAEIPLEVPELGEDFITASPIRVEDPRDPLPEELRPLLDDLWQACGWAEGTPSIDERGWVQKIREDEGLTTDKAT